MGGVSSSVNGCFVRSGRRRSSVALSVLGGDASLDWAASTDSDLVARHRANGTAAHRSEEQKKEKEKKTRWREAIRASAASSIVHALAYAWL
jgi:hypothetical protein